MKKLKWIRTVILGVCLSATAMAGPFGEVYFESVGYDHAGTLYTTLRPKWGWSLFEGEKSRIESYALLRLDMDSKTLAATDGAIVTDNYFFAGAGVDWMGVLPGVRLTALAGYAKDLVERSQRSGVEVRAGWISDHRIVLSSSGPRLSEEIYTDGLYIRRYRDFIASAQARTYWELLGKEGSTSSWDFGPLLTGAFSVDSERDSGWRYAELRAGGRLRFKYDIQLTLQAYALRGVSYDAQPAAQYYDDSRIVLTGGVSF